MEGLKMNGNYINGMEEIKADDSLKRKIISSVQQSKSKHDSRFFTFKKALVGIAIGCTFALVMTFDIPFIQSSTNIEKQGQFGVQSVLNSLVITAYAADGTPFEINPNVEFPLGEYRMTMSCVPGFPLKIVCQDADIIKLTVTDGEFLLWAPPDGQVHKKGKELEINSGDIVYWTPLKQINSDTIAANNCTISIKAYKKNKELGKKILKIESDGNYSYTGGLSQ
jgi:hypothetical protein